MKLTRNEKYLLNIIAYLRGQSCDAWGRLNAVREGKETIKQAAPKVELKQMLEELNGRLHADLAGAYGAHLPHPNDPRFSSELKHELIGRHRRAVEAGRTVKNVYDLVSKRERALSQRVSERLNRKHARTARP